MGTPVTVTDVAGGTWGTETSQYPEERKEKVDSLSSGERKGKSLNRRACAPGLWGATGALSRGVFSSSRTLLERGAGEGESPVGERWGRSLGRVPEYPVVRGAMGESRRTTA